MKNNRGVSLIVLIIAVVVIIILAGMTMQTSSDVPDKAHYTEYMQEMKNVQTGVENQKVINSRKGTSVEKLTNGFKKVYLENAPASFVSFGDINEEITGYMVSLHNISYEGSKFGQNYAPYFRLTDKETPILRFGDSIKQTQNLVNEETNEITTQSFGTNANDVYVFDATWTVYYIKGLKYDGSMNYTFE